MSSKISRRDRNKEDKRARIQRAAMELFVERGYDQTTTKAVADRAGVAAGTVFLYAVDKADLLVLAMHDELSRIVEAGFATLPAGPLLDQLVHVFSGFLRFYAEHENVAAPFVQVSISRRPDDAHNAIEMDRLTFDTVTRLAGLVDAAKAQGTIAADVPPMLLAQNAFALYFSALAAWMRKFAPTMDDAIAMMRSQFELQLRGLTPR